MTKHEKDIAGERMPGCAPEVRRLPDDSEAVLVPVASDCIPEQADIEHKMLGNPCACWPYIDASGLVSTIICRFETEDENGKPRKEIRPYSHIKIGASEPSWRWKGHPGDQKPLYNLHVLTERRDATILICEGEKTAEAAQDLFPEWVATSPMHGAKSPRLTDWSPVRDRHVVVAADLDDAGQEFARNVARLTIEHRAASASFLNLAAIAERHIEDGNIAIAEDGGELPDKFDLADALEAGWNAQLIEELFTSGGAAPRKTEPFLCPGWPFRLTSRGVEKFVLPKPRKNELPEPGYWVHVCSHLEVLGRARVTESRDWSYVLRIRDSDGKDHDILVRASDLAAPYPRDVIAELTSHGLLIEPRNRSSQDIVHYIIKAPFEERMCLVTQTGWQSDGRFVGANFFEPQSGEEVYLDIPAELQNAALPSGTLEDWRTRVAALGTDNPLLILAYSLALASVLLEPLRRTGFGLHLFGNSSTGKTTALHAAISVWGNPEKMIHTWNQTITHLENVAAVHCGSMMALDEIGQGDPDAVWRAGYMLANGQGKGRANERADARETRQWVLTFMSNGEVPFETLVGKRGSADATAGQRVRILDIPADGGAGIGIFSAVPESLTPAELSSQIKEVSQLYHGTAGPAFVAYVIADLMRVLERAKQLNIQFLEHPVLNGADGQVRRVADNLGLVAAAGELAIEAGIFPWPKHSALKAAAYALDRWIEHRGGTEADEEIQAIRKVRAYLEQHGETQFTPMSKEGGAWVITDELTGFERIGSNIRDTRDRAGFRFKDASDLTNHLVLSEAWNKRLCDGLDPRQVAAVLAKRGHLTIGRDGRKSVPRKLPGMGQTRVYEILPSIFEEEIY